MRVTNARDTPVFSAGGHCFTWGEVIEAARARGDWAVLQCHVLLLLARERDLVADGALPGSARTRAAANEFRYQHNLLTADELEEWLTRRDITVEEWMAEMRRSLLEPDEPASAPAPETDALERVCWVHAVCSGKLAEYAQTLAEEVAVQQCEEPLTPGPDALATLRGARERFRAAQPTDMALATETRNNQLGWTRMDLRSLAHRDEMVVREAALCVRQDGRELVDVAADAGAQLSETSLLLDDAEPTLRTRLLTARPGEIVGPLATGTEHLLVLVLRRVPPSLNDPAVRRRAAETIINRALAAEVNRHVNWHEQL